MKLFTLILFLAMSQICLFGQANPLQWSHITTTPDGSPLNSLIVTNGITNDTIYLSGSVILGPSTGNNVQMTNQGGNLIISNAASGGGNIVIVPGGSINAGNNITAGANITANGTGFFGGGANITGISASHITTGTIPSGTLPIDGTTITNGNGTVGVNESEFATIPSILTNMWVGTNRPVAYMSQSNIVVTGAGTVAANGCYNQTLPTLWTNGLGNGYYITNQIGSSIYVLYNPSPSPLYNGSAPGLTWANAGAGNNIPQVVWGVTLDGKNSGMNIINAQSANFAQATSYATNANSAVLLNPIYQPNQNITLITNAVNTNVFIAFGTAPDAGTFSWKPDAPWIDTAGNARVGAYTNTAFDLVLDTNGPLDAGAGEIYFVGPTNMDMSMGVFDFFTSLQFDTISQRFFPTLGPWQPQAGTGTFSVTNGLLGTLSTNAWAAMQYGTNNFDLRAAVLALPYYQNGTNASGQRSGGTVFVPPGISFCGGFQFLAGTPYSLEIDGSEGGLSVLVVTNSPKGGASPGWITVGSQLYDGASDTKFALTIKDLVICYQGADLTNAVFYAQYLSKAQVDNVTVTPFANYLTGDQFDASAPISTNQIGMRFEGVNGQMQSFTRLNSVGNHIGFEIHADHPYINTCDFESDGFGKTFVNGWGTNVQCVSGGLLLDGGFAMNLYNLHEFHENVEVINNVPPGGAAVTVEGGDWGELSTARSAIVNTGAAPEYFNFVQNSGNNSNPDRVLLFNGSAWSLSTTNALNTIEDTYTNTASGLQAVRKVGGVPSLYFNVGGAVSPLFTGNGGGLTNITGLTGIFGVTQTNRTGCTIQTNIVVYTVPSGVTNNYDVGGFINVTAIATDVIQAKVIFTDENNASQTLTLGASISGTGFNPLSVQTIRCKGGTTATVQATLTTSIGSITYDCGGFIRADL